VSSLAFEAMQKSDRISVKERQQKHKSMTLYNKHECGHGAPTMPPLLARLPIIVRISCRVLYIGPSSFSHAAEKVVASFRLSVKQKQGFVMKLAHHMHAV
jgi:hypothetical protein